MLFLCQLLLAAEMRSEENMLLLYSAKKLARTRYTNFRAPKKKLVGFAVKFQGILRTTGLYPTFYQYSLGQTAEKQKVGEDVVRCSWKSGMLSLIWQIT